MESSQPNKLTKTKVTKLVYLLDLNYRLKFNQQITKIRWDYTHYGPFVSDVYFAAKRDPQIKFDRTVTVYGHPKEILKLRQGRKVFDSRLNSYEKELIKDILFETDNLNWKEFIEYISIIEDKVRNHRRTSVDVHSFTT